jgi:RNA recognition motif-containing protein
MAKLFIVGIPRDMEEIELLELFSTYGLVNIVTIVTDQITGESKGYGFITMADVTGAERAITALDQAEIDGRVISVRFAEDRTATGIKPSQPKAPPRGKRPRRPKS